MPPACCSFREALTPALFLPAMRLWIPPPPRAALPPRTSQGTAPFPHLLLCPARGLARRALGDGQVAGYGLGGMWLMSPENSSPGDPTSLSPVPLPRAGLSLGRPHLPPRVGLVCVYVFPGRGLQGSGKGQRCGWFSRGQGSLLIPANRAWALQPAPAHPATSCWRRSGYALLLKPLPQACIPWNSS